MVSDVGVHAAFSEVMTCLSGLLWGLTETVLMTTMHLQLVAASTVTFAIAALSCAVLTRDGSWCPKSRDLV